MHPVVLAGIVGLVASGFTEGADGPKAPPIEPEAKARLDALIAAYRALPAYADHGQVKLVVKVGDRVLEQVQPASIAVARPNRLDIQTAMVRVISDGINLTSIVHPLKKYETTPAPKKFAESSLRGGPLGAVEFGGLPGLPLVHILNLVIGDDPERLIYDFSPTILVEPDQVVDGTSYKVLRLDESDNHDWRFLIDPKTGLLAFVDLVVEGDATKSSIAGDASHVESLRWTAGAISTGPKGAEAFVFAPPASFTAVPKLEGTAKREAPGHPLIGKPAPDFTIDVLDGPDKTRRVSKADLAGKVVLIDLWATWCPPCIKELPDIQKLIEAYAKDKKDVVVIALSIDRSELGDLKEVRPKVEATLEQLKVTLTAPGNPVGLIGLDPLAAIAQKYDAGAIPFVVLIDGQGIVRQVHVGLTEGSVLTSEIDAVLAGKPVAGGK